MPLIVEIRELYEDSERSIISDTGINFQGFYTKNKERNTSCE